jgi:hypothetical protein
LECAHDGTVAGARRYLVNVPRTWCDDKYMPKDQAFSAQEPMTAAQAAELKRLAAEALESDAFDPSLTKAEAAKRIEALKARLRLLSEPPHTA